MAAPSAIDILNTRTTNRLVEQLAALMVSLTRLSEQQGNCQHKGRYSRIAGTLPICGILITTQSPSNQRLAGLLSQLVLITYKLVPFEKMYIILRAIAIMER
jgi:hypothetical protein